MKLTLKQECQKYGLWAAPGPQSPSIRLQCCQSQTGLACHIQHTLAQALTLCTAHRSHLVYTAYNMGLELGNAQGMQG